MPKPVNPPRVPTGGNMTFAAETPISREQLRMLAHLRRLCGNPPTWEADCSTILGGFDGPLEVLSQAAGSWLIGNFQAALAATKDPDDDLQIEGSPV